MPFATIYLQNTTTCAKWCVFMTKFCPYWFKIEIQYLFPVRRCLMRKGYHTWSHIPFCFLLIKHPSRASSEKTQTMFHKVCFFLYYYFEGTCTGIWSEEFSSAFEENCPQIFYKNKKVCLISLGKNQINLFQKEQPLARKRLSLADEQKIQCTAQVKSNQFCMHSAHESCRGLSGHMVRQSL